MQCSGGYYVYANVTLFVTFGFLEYILHIVT